MKKQFRKQFIFLISACLVIGFLAGVVGELWINSFLLPDPYLNFNNYSDLSQKINDLIVSDKENLNLSKQDKAIEEPINQVKPAVMDIYRYKDFTDLNVNTLEKDELLGQGVVVTNDGWILTNNSVIKNTSQKILLVDNDHNIYKSELILNDTKTGSVFIKILANNLPVVEFKLKNGLIAGQTVLVFGHDNEVSLSSLMDLHYSKINNFDDYSHSSENFYKFLKLENSFPAEYIGSPVITLDNKMIGFLNSADGEVLPIDYLVPLLKNIGQTYDWPYLGVNYYDLSEILNSKIDNKKGAMILKNVGVDYYSPAKAVLLGGDIVLKVENEEINNKKTLSELVSHYQVGDQIQLTILRDGQEKQVEITLITQ